ncbi:MAG TPA: ATP-binding cassette domain-containing protein, partial [Coriobacteriia bacterium]|nr:ATP-binding cassette domain-containing protein [Coriobacteriia bacterium]
MADEARTPLLEFRGVDTYYGRIRILKDVDYRVYPGEIVCLLGGNASGKSTTMKAILGIVKPTKGEVLFDGRVVNGLRTAERIKLGIATVPENRRLF